MTLYQLSYGIGTDELFGVESPTFGIAHSILTDQSFNLEVSTLVGKVHTISAKRKTISAESIQFRKWPVAYLEIGKGVCHNLRRGADTPEGASAYD